MKQITVGVLAHVDAGKTTLCEALLYRAGCITKLGRVDHRTSFLDTDRLERDRGITIFSKQAMLTVGDTVFTLLDTPGHVDFSAETERTLQVLDYAILIISGTDGVQSHTRTLWNLLEKYRVPCLIFVNKMDMDGADRAFLLRQLRGKLSDNCIDFGTAGTPEFFENVALCSEALLARYDETGDAQTEDIVDAIRNRQMFPCLFGSALKLTGVDDFLQCLQMYTQMPAYPTDFAAKVFKIGRDPQGNRLTFLKVTGGCLNVKTVLESKKNLDGEKVQQIRLYSGEKFSPAQTAKAGTVCAVTGISFTRPGDGLGAQEDAGLPVLEPVLTYRVILPPGTDAHTALGKMRVLESEDPQLRVTWSDRLGEMQVCLMGEVQLEVLQTVFRERFGIPITFGPGHILYKETITNTVEGVGHFEPLRHYAEVHLLLKPGPRDSGLVIKTACREDQLDKNWQRLILTHLTEKTHAGVLTGAPITDMVITLAAGRAHAKHTEGGDFRQATYRAVRQGLRTAKSLLLEPIFAFVLEVPQENVGRALADLQRLNGRFDPPLTEGDSVRITGTAPVATMHDYMKDVVQYTRGRGRLACTLKGYAPCHNAEAVIEDSGYDCDADVDNPCDSVFCSHGAGYTVKWSDVPKHMHLPSVLTGQRPPAETQSGAPANRPGGQRISPDKELMRIYEQTYGPVKNRALEMLRVDNPPFDDPPPRPPRPPKPKKAAAQYDGPEYLLVDGYNVIFSWDTLRLISEENIDAAREVLIRVLCNYQGYRQCEVILVFDAYKVKGSREVERVGGISIVYTKEAETADAYIEKTSHQLAKHHKVRVVTSDAMEQLIILGGGALRVSSREFEAEVQQAQEEIRGLLGGTS
ncbi:MAG: TetM/TetW/TetO/TetS family tetracycline resistance ribosomal protection protein [Clostridia bacterium]|nr:TetM/TetW/TetO/TetS family tetracycline resistance ribosomal protection protein [Clostridia bacterium]